MGDLVFANHLVQLRYHNIFIPEYATAWIEGFFVYDNLAFDMVCIRVVN